MLQGFYDDIPERIIAVKHAMQMARLYNNHTGAQITHWDVLDWGIMEEEEIIIAIELLGL